MSIGRYSLFMQINCSLCKYQNRSVSPRVENIYLPSTIVVKNMVSGLEIMGPEPGSLLAVDLGQIVSIWKMERIAVLT